MNKLSSYLQPVCLLCLLGVARFSHAQPPAPLVAFANGPTASKALLLRRPATDVVAPAAPLVPQPNATPGWISLAGSLPTDAPLTAELVGTGASPVASRTWRGLTAGRVQLELNLRSVPAGAYVLCLSQDGQQWRLPLAVK